MQPGRESAEGRGQRMWSLWAVLYYAFFRGCVEWPAHTQVWVSVRGSEHFVHQKADEPELVLCKASLEFGFPILLSSVSVPVLTCVSLRDGNVPSSRSRIPLKALFSPQDTWLQYLRRERPWNPPLEGSMLCLLCLCSKEAVWIPSWEKSSQNLHFTFLFSKHGSRSDKLYSIDKNVILNLIQFCNWSFQYHPSPISISTVQSTEVLHTVYWCSATFSRLKECAAQI